MSDKSLGGAYRLLAGRSAYKSRSPMKTVKRPVGRPKKTQPADPTAPPARRVRKLVPPRVESEGEDDDTQAYQPTIPANRHLASLRPRQSSVPLPVQPSVPKPAPEALKTIPEIPRHVSVKKKENVEIKLEPARIVKAEEKLVAAVVSKQTINDGRQRVYRIISSSTITLPPTIPPPANGHGSLLPPLFYEPLKLLSGGIRLGSNQTLEKRGVNRSILHSFKCDVDFPSASQVVIVRFARSAGYAPFLISPALDVNPDNLQITCNGDVVLKVDNVNYGIKAHVSLVGAPIEIQKDFLRPITNLIVEYTVRDNNSPEDFLLFVELARRRLTDELVREVQQRRLTVDAGALRAFKILSPDEDEGIESGSSIVNLKCPLSRLRLENPVRGRECRHIECFSAASYIEMNKTKKPKWACPKCSTSVPFEDLILDEFMVDVLSFTSQPTVDIVSENSQLVVRETKMEKAVKAVFISDKQAPNCLDSSIVILD